MKKMLLFRCSFILFFFLSISDLAQGQPDPIKFGQVDGKDLTAAPFVGDSAAGAVVLCDYGRSRLQGKGVGFQVIFERVTRIKILKKSGYEAASVEIPLYHRENDSEKIDNLRGFTYNLVNGQVEKTKLETSGVFLEKRDPNWNVQKFTLPKVTEGSVIEYSYTLTSDFLFNFQDWTFQRDIPVHWSEYRVSIPVFYKYKIIYQSSQPFTVNKASVGSTSLQVDNRISASAGLAAGTTVGSLIVTAPTEEHQWAMKNVPAFENEPYMTTATDYLTRLDFELSGEQWPDSPYHDLSGDWNKISERLLTQENFGDRMEHTGFLKDQMQALAARYPDVVARAAAVREAVMTAVRYNGANRYTTDAPLRKAYEAHRGTSADVNQLLIAALHDAGLPAQPVLLSTRDHGFVNQEFPLTERFNYVVALLKLPDGKDLLVDATEPLLPCGVLPERCLNQAGRVIAAADGRWVPLKPAQRWVHFQQVNLVLDAQGGLVGKVHDEHAGYAALAARQDLAEQGEKKYQATLLHHHEGWVMPTFIVAEAENPTKPLVLDYEFSRPAEEQTAASTLYMSPLADFGFARNPFQRETRNFTVDFGTEQEEIIQLSLTLPSGYELAEPPKSAAMNLPDNGGRFLYSVATTTPGMVQLISRLTLRNTSYPAEQYAALRELYRNVLEKQAQKLVIRKKA